MNKKPMLMYNKIMGAKTLNVLAGVGLALCVPATAFGQSTESTVFEPTDKSDTARTRTRNGVKVLRATNEEYTNEMPSIAQDPSDPTKLVVVEMSSRNVLSSGDQRATGNNRQMQGACYPATLQLDPNTDAGVKIAQKPNAAKYITNRNGNDARNFNIPETFALDQEMDVDNDGTPEKLFGVAANYQPANANNTERYLQVVTEDCELVPLTGNTPRIENNTAAQIMAKNDDNCSGGQSGLRGDVRYENGTAQLIFSELCNGNGRDDGWANRIDVTCSNGSCNVQKKWDTSYIKQEERSRGRCVFEDLNKDGQMNNQDVIFCTGTEGNNQPQREGVWAAGIDPVSGDLLWRKRLAYRGTDSENRRNYAMRIKLMRNPSGSLEVEYQMHRGRNNGNKKGGYDVHLVQAEVNPTRSGVTMTNMAELRDFAIQQGVEFTHTHAMTCRGGNPAAPTDSQLYLGGSFNGSSEINGYVLKIDKAADGSRMASRFSMDAPWDHQKYSKYLGNNPNNQGRNYVGTIYGGALKLTSEMQTALGVPDLQAIVFNGKATTTSAEPQYKPDTIVGVINCYEKAGDSATAPTPIPNISTPEGEGNSDNPSNPSASASGCQSNSLPVALIALVFFVGLALRRREVAAN